MSYTFTVKGIGKSQAIDAIDGAMSTAAADPETKDQVKAAAAALVKALADDDTCDVQIAIRATVLKTSSGVRHNDASLSATLVPRPKVEAPKAP
jgi:hypothetical protein